MFSNICSTSKEWKMPVINIILWLMYTMKITIVYINKNEYCLLIADVMKKEKEE